MGQTLSNGLYLPDEGERNSYAGLESNWRTLDALILTVDGKAAPNVANTWTAAQTFTAGIAGDLTGNVTGNVTGDLTGTASKAIADEDGTSIKTGYVNVAGNQTVSGQKTWSGNQFYTAGAYHRNNSYEIGNTPASNVDIPIYFTDKINVHTGYVRNVILTTGKTQSELLARNKFTNGALSPTGTDVSSTLQVEVQSNGDKTLYFDGSIRNNVLPYVTNTYSLGSSSYQWSSVYAQTYYYNGTAWGLDKVNEWSNTNRFLTSITLKNNSLEKGVAPSSASSKTFYFTDKNNDTLATIVARTNPSGSSYLSLVAENLYKNGAMDSTGSAVKGGFFVGTTAEGKPFCDANGDLYPENNNTFNLGTSTNKWKTLNGVNPGALSLPDLNTSTAVDTTNWVYDGATFNEIKINNATQTISGWLYIIINNASSDDVIVVRYAGSDSGNLTYAQYKSGLSYVSLVAPIMPGVKTYVASRKAFSTIKIYHSLGNV